MVFGELFIINGDDYLPEEYKGEKPPEDFAEQVGALLDCLMTLPNGDVCHVDHVEENGYKFIG